MTTVEEELVQPAPVGVAGLEAESGFVPTTDSWLVIASSMLIGTVSLMIVGLQPVLLGALTQEGRIDEVALGQGDARLSRPEVLRRPGEPARTHQPARREEPPVSAFCVYAPVPKRHRSPRLTNCMLLPSYVPDTRPASGPRLTSMSRLPLHRSS